MPTRQCTRPRSAERTTTASSASPCLRDKRGVAEGPELETQAFLAHNTHQPSGLTVPSTRLQVFFAELKFMQLLHFCSPLGCAWYFASAFDSFSGNFGASDSFPLEQAPNS